MTLEEMAEQYAEQFYGRRETRFIEDKSAYLAGARAALELAAKQISPSEQIPHDWTCGEVYLRKKLVEEIRALAEKGAEQK